MNDSTQAPQRYSREWFMAAADQAQAKVDEWPAQMRRNAVIAEARMPRVPFFQARKP